MKIQLNRISGTPLKQWREENFRAINADMTREERSKIYILSSKLKELEEEDQKKTQKLAEDKK